MEDMEIKSEEDFRAKLDELWKLWECKPETREWERFKQLSQILHEYEKENFPM